MASESLPQLFLSSPRHRTAALSASMPFANTASILGATESFQDEQLTLDKMHDFGSVRYSDNLHAGWLSPRHRKKSLRDQPIRIEDLSCAVTSDNDADRVVHFDRPPDNNPIHCATRCNATSARCKLAAIRAVAVTIVACFVFHVLALLVYCSSIYRSTIQPWIIERVEPLVQPYQSREDVASFVYLLFCGVVPTALAGTLWHIFKGAKTLHVALQSNQLSHLLLHKPSFSLPAWCRSRSSPSNPTAAVTTGTSHEAAAKSAQLYVDATWGDIVFLLSLLVICTVLLIIVLVADGISSISSASTVFRVLGKSFGYMSLLTMSWLLLTIDRASFWMAFFHLPHPLSTKYRHWLGVTTLVFAVAHCICHATTFYLRHQFVSQLLPHFGAIYQETPIRDANGVNAVGEVALGAMLVMCAVSVPTFRKRWYALYMCIQRVASAVAILAVCVHASLALWWLFPPLVMLLTQRILAGHHVRYPVEIVDMAPLPNGIARLVCRRRCQLAHHHRVFTPGQFVYLYASRVSWLQWHPFYVASSPSAHSNTFSVYVQAKGDWAESFFDLSKLAYATQEAPLVFVDGFYGPSTSMYYEQHECLVLLADGIGITGVIAMLEELFFVMQSQHAARGHAQWQPQRSSTARGNTSDNYVRSTRRQVWLFWVCKDVCLFKEFEALLVRIRAFDPTERCFCLRLYLTTTPTARVLTYVPPVPCDFQPPDELCVKTKEPTSSNPHEHHAVAMPPNAAAHKAPPQNRSGCCVRVNSRPFQAACASPIYQILVLAAVLSATLALATHVEWQDQLHGSGIFGGEANAKVGMFRPMHRTACVVVILLGCFAAYAVIACEEIWRLVTTKRERSSRAARALALMHRTQRRANDTENSDAASVCATALSTTMSSATHWIEMSPHVEQQQQQCDSRAGKSTEARDTSAAMIDTEAPAPTSTTTKRGTKPPSHSCACNVVETLHIALQRPDVDALMTNVALHVSATASRDASVGVFASGHCKFLDAADDAVGHAATAPSDSSASSLRAVDFRFHRLTLQ